MPYLADLLAGFPGFRGTVRSRDWLGPGEDEELTQGGNSGGFGTDPAKRRPGPVDLLSPTSAMRSETALADAYAAPVSGRSSQQQYGSVAPPNPDIIRRAQLASLGAPLQAREPPAGSLGIQAGEWANGPRGGPPRGGPGVPPPMSRPTAPQGQAPPMNPQGAGMPVPQAGGSGQPQPPLPSGRPSPVRDFLSRAGSAAGDLLGGARDWANAPMYDPSKPTSRWDAIAMTLGNVGAGLSQTGRIGAGLRAGNQGLMELRQSEQRRAGDEEERQYRRQEMELRRRKLEQEAVPQPFGGQETGYYRMGPDGTPQQIVPPGAGAGDKATNAFQAYWQSLPADQRTPEVAQAWEERQQALKDAPTAAEQRRLELSEQRDARSEAAARRAEEAGNRAAAAQIRQENAARQKEEQDRMQAGVGLRKEFNSSPEVKAYRSIVAPIRSALESAGRNDRISDIDLVFALGKTFDPNSVVRESEQGMILEAQGVPDWIQGAMNSLTGEAKLQPAVRKQILATLKSRASGLRKSAEQQRQEYVGYAAGSRLKPDEVIPTLEELPDLPDAPSATPAASTTPAPAALQARIGQTATPEEKAQLPRANSRDEALALPAGQFFVGPGDVIGRR